MTDVRSYLHYFQNLTKEHKGIRDFYIMDIQEPLASIRGNMTFPAMIMNTLTGNFIAPSHDNTQDELKGGFLIIDHLADLDDFSGEMLMFQNTKQLGLDIISRMNYDLQKCELRALKSIQGFRIDSVSYQMVDGLFDNCFGFLFSFQIVSPIDLIYYASKWDVNNNAVGEFQY